MVTCTGQRIPCFDTCQLAITWMPNNKDVPVKKHGLHHRVSHWHTLRGGRMVTKAKFSRTDGLS